MFASSLTTSRGGSGAALRCLDRSADARQDSRILQEDDPSRLAREKSERKTNPMAHLTQSEFQRAIQILADEMGLQRLRDKFFNLNGLVTRRKVSSAESLATQLFQLSSGLRRQVPSALAFQAIWAESVHDKIGEDGEENLEKLGEKVNECLGENDEIKADKDADLETALKEYESTLASTIGEEKARLDMLMKAVSAVAERLRGGGSADAATAAESSDKPE